MKEQLVKYETAKLAKEKGLRKFLNNDGYLLGYNLSKKEPYPSSYKVFMSFPSEDEWLFAPTQSLLQKWLREVHNIHITIGSIGNTKFTLMIDETTLDGTLGKNADWTTYKTYEEALEIGLQEALKLI